MEIKTAVISAKNYQLRNYNISAISGSSSMDKNGKIHVTFSNLNPNKDFKLDIFLDGKGFTKVNFATILIAPAFKA